MKGPRLFYVIGIRFPEVNPQVVGGTVDNNESPEEAIIREVFEESGLNLSIKRKIGEFEYYVSDP